MTDSLRIAYLTSAFARPSDTFIRNEVNQLRELGVEVETFSIRRPEVAANVEEDVRRHQANTEYLLEAGIVEIACHAALQTVLHPLRFLRAARLAWRTAAPGTRGLLLQVAYLVESIYLASRMRERTIELVHNHFGENSATVAMLAAEFGGIPFSLTIHGPSIFFAPQRWALGEKVRRSAFTTCISHFCRSQCMAFAPESAWQKLHVVRCSVQPRFIQTPRDCNPPDEPHFLCVGRLCIEKGQSLLIEAAAQLLNAGHRFRVTLAGDGPARASLEQLIRKFNISEHVKIVGWQSTEQIEELLLRSSALVIPSFAEGLPIVAMESLATYRPVIATNIAAMSELVENGKSGWLIPAGSVAHLAEAMQTASGFTPTQLKKMGEIGRQKVLDLHDPVRQADQLRALFCGVAEGAKAGLGGLR